MGPIRRGDCRCYENNDKEELKMDLLLVISLIVLILFHFRKVFSEDLSQIWSPVTIISLCYIYYCIVPYFTGGSEKYTLGDTSNTTFLAGSLLSYCAMLFGFSRETGADFKSWNSAFSKNNINSSAVLIFLIAFAGYASFRGIHFTFIAQDNITELVHTSFEHYFIELALLYVASVSLFIFTLKEKTNRIWMWFILYYVLVSMLFAGTRSRIVFLAIALLSIIYLYPKPKRPNYLIVASLMVGLFMLFSVMEYSRQYSLGLRMDRLQMMTRNDATKGADENNSVYWFSSLVMNEYEKNGNYILFEPIVTAVCMPVPRAIFPWKPNGQYLIDTQNMCIGNAEGGAAFTYFTEGFISFWWLGVLLYGWFLGWLSRRFWDNYQRNPESIGACLALALYSAFCYAVISRGYLASSFEIFIYMVCLPFWIVKLAGRISSRFLP